MAKSKSNQRKYYVYVYKNPIDGVPFYVGKGCGNRCYKHLKETKDNTENYKKYCIIKYLRNLGLSPEIEIISSDLSESDAYDLEKMLIEKYGRRDIDDNGVLTNVCSDQRPPRIPLSEEERKRRRERMLGNTLGHTWKGKKVPSYIRQRISEAVKANHPHRGKSMHQVLIEKYGKEEGDRRWQESIIKRQASNKGFKHTEESKIKMREVQKEANKGRIWITQFVEGNPKYKFINPTELDEFIQLGWHKGRLGFNAH